MRSGSDEPVLLQRLRSAMRRPCESVLADRVRDRVYATAHAVHGPLRRSGDLANALWRLRHDMQHQRRCQHVQRRAVRSELLPWFHRLPGTTRRLRRPVQRSPELRRVRDEMPTDCQRRSDVQLFAVYSDMRVRLGAVRIELRDASNR